MRLFLFATLSILFWTGCRYQESQLELEDPILSEQSSPPPSPKLEPKPDPYSKRELLKFTLRLSKVEEPFTPDDLTFLNNMPKSNLNPFMKAALVVGHLRQAASVASTSSGLDGEQVALEEIFASYPLDLGNLLKSNVALKNHRVYELTLRVLATTSDQEPYKRAIQELIYSEAKSWAALLPEPEAGDIIEGDLSSKEEEAPIDGEQTTPQSSTALGISPVDLNQPDATIQAATDLAESGEYRKAIEKLRSVSESSPLYESAQSKIKSYSNLAVQALRRQAAEAFQDAVPVDQTQTKINYLNQAKAYLEQALSDYPDAEQLDTVKANLAVIDEDLARLVPSEEAEEQTESE